MGLSQLACVYAALRMAFGMVLLYLSALKGNLTCSEHLMCVSLCQQSELQMLRSVSRVFDALFEAQLARVKGLSTTTKASGVQFHTTDQCNRYNPFRVITLSFMY